MRPSELFAMQAQSEFAKTKSMAEQRRFLPVYSVRQVHSHAIAHGLVLQEYHTPSL